MSIIQDDWEELETKLIEYKNLLECNRYRKDNLFQACES